MRKMKKIISFAIIFFLLSLTYHPSLGEEEDVRIVTHLYGAGMDASFTIEVSKEKAGSILDDLKNLDDAIKKQDEFTAMKIASGLKENGVFRDDAIFTMIKNYMEKDTAPYAGINDTNFTLKNLMCFVVGYGDALFAYPADLLAIFFIVALLGWMPMGIILVLAYSALWMYFSHLIPVRFVFPVTLIGINKGEITTIGLKGVQTISREGNESTAGMLVGFAGVVVNVFLLPKNDREMSAPFFCFGTSLMAYEKADI
ncbi:MAG: hypothetical protein J7L93_01185 [Thermoplasmata archaeon]|nr:hypothetical protein [Thermoplasmata archaeon]